jgi:hypothetical protein
MQGLLKIRFGCCTPAFDLASLPLRSAYGYLFAASLQEAQRPTTPLACESNLPPGYDWGDL